MTQRPDERRAVIVRMDAPELPFLANLIDAGFTAIVREGWSVLVPDAPVDPAVIAAQQTGPLCIAVASDGSRRTLTVYPEPNPAFGPRERRPPAAGAVPRAGAARRCCWVESARVLSAGSR